ncbi:MAG: ABC transporter permease subunit [bacterium]|nr:ABC transporter permease subunit [bacterium]MCY3953478.1 ABC transporter permease subunit [bacterium]MCY4103478.1 ABC transporter permease subunit [bacterium]
MTVLAQSEAPGVGDNAVLDQWDVPFGAWINQMVSWIDQNLAPVLDVFEWPFTFLFRNFVNGPAHHPWWEIADMPWIAVCVVFLVIGWFTRNLRVGVSVALALALCGILGTEYWKETVITLGIIIVAVALCAIIGIPLGILCGRFDGAWNVVRPVLDAMQVVHPFIYMLPIIFFFGIGAEPATMVTMVFALPPLIRLTNLGIRQVPSDVVEAARAYGASEGRVLRDVQLPLARPAIMTGLNQTLLLSISMLGIAAIMASGGLGRPVFQAVQNLDTAQAASSGLALFIVAVVLDRISQTEESDGEYLLTRIRKAWRHRLNPEALLPTAATIGAVAATEAKPAPAAGAERRGATLALAGAALGVVSVFLTWGSDSGLISGYGRLVDLDLAGRSFNGLAAEGGSVYGYAVLAFSLLVAASALVTLQRPGRGARWLGADGALVFALGGLVSAGAYLWATPHGASAAYSDGIGVWLALIGTAVATVGAAAWLRVAPFTPRRPLVRTVATGRIVGVAAAAVVVVIAGFSGWTFDERAESVISPELAAEIEELRRQAEEDPASASEATLKMTALINEAQRTEKIVTDGFTSGGPRFGYLALIVAAAGVVCALLASGLFGHDERRKWIWSTATAGFATGVTMIAFNWIGSLTRVADAKLVSGAGAFLCLMGGLMLLATTRAVLGEFRRAEVYVQIGDEDSSDAEPARDAELAGARTQAAAG